MKKKLTFLGSGGSAGIPVIGCSCTVCLSNDLLNQRLRPSVLLQIDNRRYLIDAGPDFRLQALRYGVTELNGLLLTHAHYDHTAGIDDLRPLCFRRVTPLPILLSAETALDLRVRYSYMFQPQPGQESFVPRLDLQILPQLVGQIDFEGLPLQYVTYKQMKMSVNGYRIGDLAYLTDIRDFSSSLFETLKGVRYLIISALRYTQSLFHLSVDEAIDFAKKLKVEKTWLTHISHELEHHQTNAYLPANMCLAYDGLEIEFE